MNLTGAFATKLVPESELFFAESFRAFPKAFLNPCNICSVSEQIIISVIRAG